MYSRTTKILVDIIPGKSEEERGLEILLGGANGGRLKLLSNNKMSPEAFQYCNLTLEKLGATVRLKPVGDSVELFNVNNLHSVDPKQINVWHSFDASFDAKPTKLKGKRPFGTPNSPVRQQQRSSKPPGTFMRTNPARKGTFLRSTSKAKQHTSKHTKAETSLPSSSSSNRGQMQSFLKAETRKINIVVTLNDFKKLT